MTISDQTRHRLHNLDEAAFPVRVTRVERLPPGDIISYHFGGAPMGDILIRGVSDEVLAAIDSKAHRLGLSRSEYLRRRLAADVGGGPVTAADLESFAATFAELADPAVMVQAWE